jgi:hypothetical protein
LTKERWGTFSVRDHIKTAPIISDVLIYDRLVIPVPPDDVNKEIWKKMNGIDLSRQILELDTNVKICFITAGEANIEVLRELYPTRSIGCYIKKPVTIDQLVRRVKAELE